MTSIRCDFFYVVFQITIPVLLNFTIFSVRSIVSQYIVNLPSVVVYKVTWFNHDSHTLNPLSFSINQYIYAPVLSCLYSYFVPHIISHPLTMCIIFLSCFLNNLQRLEPPCFFILELITLVARDCFFAAHISDSISNRRCADWNHLFHPSISTNVSLYCCLGFFHAFSCCRIQLCYLR